MAIEKGIESISRRAAATLQPHRAVQINGSNQFAVPAGQGQRCFGITLNGGAAGEVVEVAHEGIVKAEVAAAVAAGQVPLTCNADGRLETALAADFILAYSTGEAATGAGQLIAVKLVHDGVL